MDFYILCFGRTDFTKSTVDSILKNATETPRIHLINNGWNKSIVPAQILAHWDTFIADYTKTGALCKVIEFETALIGAALDVLSIANSDSENSFYWISDNDCIVNTPGFDVEAMALMKNNPELPKLGVDFYRKISIEHSRKFADYITGFDHYLFACTDGRIVPAGMEVDYCGLAGTKPSFYKDDPKINTNLADTTLSICRKGLEITQQKNRISYSMSEMEMLHVGYLEPIFNNGNDASILEMLHYMNLRPMILTEFTDDYASRKNQYISNLVQSGLADKLVAYNRLIENKSVLP